MSRIFRKLLMCQFKSPPKCHRSYCNITQLIPEYDVEYLINPANRDVIIDNMKRRGCRNNLKRIVELHEKWKTEADPPKKEILLNLLRDEVCEVPNQTHPVVRGYGEKPVKIRSTRTGDVGFVPKAFDQLAADHGVIRMKELTPLTGRRGYFLIGALAELEQALVKYTVSKLLGKNFKLISVPDILPEAVIKGCGMNTTGERAQVFRLKKYHGQNMCLSGTAEMGLACLLANSVTNMSDLPVCLASVSRCHRAELSTVREEQGLFRVHHFTKVEMFGLSLPSKSEELFERFVNIQDEIFTSLGLDFNVLDMPMNDLGNSAYRKFDIEAWFPGQGTLGEVSSCTNCTDFQARKLNMTYKDKDGMKYVHTVNGTACAVPRTLMAIFETHQLENGNVKIPEPLQLYFNGREEIQKVTFEEGMKQQHRSS